MLQKRYKNESMYFLQQDNKVIQVKKLMIPNPFFIIYIYTGENSDEGIYRHTP